MLLQSRVSELVGKRKQLEKDCAEKKQGIVKGKKRQTAIEDTQALLQTAAKETQGEFKIHLEDIVQTALDTCFPGKYTFCIEFIIKRGSTVCDIYLVNKYGRRVYPEDSTGGGVVDIVSFALRLAVWTLKKHDNVLVLDEPFKWLSAGLRPLAGELLQNLSKKLKIQIIMCTHDPLLIEIADRVFQVAKNRKEKSRVRVVEG